MTSLRRARKTARRRAELNQLQQGLEESRECYYDSLAEHQGEVARFGDSWPGAQLQLARMSRWLSWADARIARLSRQLLLTLDVNLDRLEGIAWPAGTFAEVELPF